MTSVELPDNLFGGQAPIREVRFVAEANYIVAPRWLLRGITYFTSNQQIPLQDLVNTLAQMPTLHSFTLKRCVLEWGYFDTPPDVQIRMPNLMYFSVDIDAGSPIFFGLLHRRLSLPDGAKKRIRTHKSFEAYDLYDWRFGRVPMVPTYVQEVVKATNGLAGSILRWEPCRSFLLWTGDAGYEEADFSFEFNWRLREYDRDFLIVSFDLLPLFNLLGVERVHITLLMN